MQRTVLITGAGSGLGRALALRHARAGWSVACADIHLDRARDTCAAITADGGEALALPLDIADDASWEALREALAAHWPRLDRLVNNAGVSGGGDAADVAMDDWRWMLDINLLGVVRGCRCFVPQLRAQGGGSILNIASFAALAGAPGLASYTVAKAGVLALSESLRGELAAHGIAVSVACPAFFPTRLLENFRAPDERVRQVAERLMAASRDSADGIAAAVFDAVERGRFLVLPTARERWLWRLKRWAPEFYHRRLLAAIHAQRPAGSRAAGRETTWTG